MNEFRQLKHIKEPEFPSRLHGRIMQTLYLRRFKVPLLAVNGVLFLNFFLSGWYVLRSGGAAMSAPGVGDALFLQVWQGLRNVPTGAFSIVLLNAVLLGAGIYAFLKLNTAILRMSRTRASLREKQLEASA